MYFILILLLTVDVMCLNYFPTVLDHSLDLSVKPNLASVTCFLSEDFP